MPSSFAGRMTHYFLFVLFLSPILLFEITRELHPHEDPAGQERYDDTQEANTYQEDAIQFGCCWAVSSVKNDEP